MSPGFYSLLSAVLLLTQCGSALSFRLPLRDTPILPALAPEAPGSNDGLLTVGHPILAGAHRAMNTIEKVKEMPSCQKVATAALLHSCSALEGAVNHEQSKGSQGSDLIICEAIKVYGARLAVCELGEGSAQIPDACEAFVPTERSTRKRAFAGHVSNNGFSDPTELYLDYDEITQQHLDQCLAALAERTQSWMSYSNSKQNAVAYCNAMHSMVQKDVTINIYEEMIKSAAELGLQLNTSAQEYEAMFRQVKANVMQFWMDLYENDAAKRDEIKRFWDSLKDQLQDSVVMIIQDFKRNVAELQKFGSDVTEKNIEVYNQAFANMSNRMSAVAAQQEDSVAGTMELFEYAVAIVQEQLTQSIGSATQGLQVQQELIDSTYQRVLQLGIAVANNILQVETMEGRMKALQSATVLLRNTTLSLTKEVQLATDQTLNHLGEVNVEVDLLEERIVEAANSTIALLSGGWPNMFVAVKVAGTFSGYAVVYTLLAFAVWDWLGVFSLIANVAGALATGLSVSFISTFYFGPADLGRLLWHVLTRAKTSDNDSLITGLVLGTTGCFAIVCIIAAFRRFRAKRQEASLYEPFDRAEKIWSKEKGSKWVI